jgi:hypothetical protein
MKTPIHLMIELECLYAGRIGVDISRHQHEVIDYE